MVKAVFITLKKGMTSYIIVKAIWHIHQCVQPYYDIYFFLHGVPVLFYFIF